MHTTITICTCSVSYQPTRHHVRIFTRLGTIVGSFFLNLQVSDDRGTTPLISTCLAVPGLGHGKAKLMTSVPNLMGEVYSFEGGVLI